MFEGLKGKKILVTGASSGIGACIAKLLAHYGAIVGIHYRKNKEGAENTLKEIKENGGKAVLLKGDLLEESTRTTLIKSFVDACGGIDVLINNAGGIYKYTPFLELDEKSWQDTFTINAMVPFFLTKSAFSFMKEQGGGKVINISSISAKYGGSLLSLHYGSSKAALDAFTVGLARVGAPHNILVNSVRGGMIDTQLHEMAGKEDTKGRIELIPLKRVGKPLDIARMVLFLVSDAGNYITGEIFTVAGGD